MNSAGKQVEFACDYVISTMPVRDLILGLNPPAPTPVREVAAGLQYRDFITVGVLVKKLRPNRGCLPGHPANLLPDTWIYIQEPDVKLGRLQIFNNWSPAMVHSPDTIWLGLEYFCREGDELWRLDDDAMGRFAVAELAKIDLIDPGRRARLPRRPRAQGLPRLLRDLRSIRRLAALLPMRSVICFWWGATACTATTIRITRC